MADDLRIQVDGLPKLRKALRGLENGAHKDLRPAFNRAAEIVVREAQARVPRRTGRAAGSIRAASTQTAARVRAGGAKVPYYPWLDFGGRVGPRKSVKRSFSEEGRYLYPAIRRTRPQIRDLAEKEINEVIRRHGLA